jgi:hypothetical protein
MLAMGIIPCKGKLPRKIRESNPGLHDLIFRRSDHQAARLLCLEIINTLYSNQCTLNDNEMHWLESVREKNSVSVVFIMDPTHWGAGNWNWVLFRRRPCYLSLRFPFSLLQRNFPIESNDVILYGLYHLNYPDKRRSWYMGVLYCCECDASCNITKGYETLIDTYWGPNAPHTTQIWNN